MATGIPLYESPQDFDHLLDPVSGYDGMHDLQYKAAPAEDEVFNRGSLISLDADGNFEAGLGGSGANRMPLWAINASYDLDVKSDSGNISGGVVAAYPATGGFELVSTEFDTTGTYAPNDPLIDDDSVATGAMKLGTKPYAASETIVGIVSKGVFTETYNQTVIQFWPVCLPARA